MRTFICKAKKREKKRKEKKRKDLFSNADLCLVSVIVGNISFTISFYCLFTFYLATKSILRASKANKRQVFVIVDRVVSSLCFVLFQPLLKFVSIKLVVFWVSCLLDAFFFFLLFLSSFLVSGVLARAGVCGVGGRGSGAADVAVLAMGVCELNTLLCCVVLLFVVLCCLQALMLNNAIITVEMFSVAVLHVFAYPHDVYRVATQSQRPLVAAAGGANKKKRLRFGFGVIPSF
jgi:hypothetical protein